MDPKEKTAKIKAMVELAGYLSGDYGLDDDDGEEDDPYTLGERDHASDVLELANLVLEVHGE